LPRPVGGFSGGSEGHVYLPTTSKARAANPHTPDISELFVSLVEAHRGGGLELLSFDPEPYSHVQPGSLEVKPGGRLHVRRDGREFVAFLELTVARSAGRSCRPRCVATSRRTGAGRTVAASRSSCS